ncbi:bifunctional adenosylcobinamide kinase/adenosylcobinamide-phosphate guanylyltransferase [Chloroflexota bacterium]
MKRGTDRINTLIIGGARSGKSDFAQGLAAKSGKKVLFVATAEAGDEEMRQRIEKHKQSRPSSWITLETATNIGKEILEKAGDTELVIVDCITLLVNNIFSKFDFQADTEIDDTPVEKEVILEVNQLIDCFHRLDASFIIVTNEVGMDLVPANKIGRLYRDMLGRANQLLAEQVDVVYLMVAGLPVQIKSVNSP